MNLVEIMNLGVVVTDCERKILYLNENFKKFTDYSGNNKIGLDLADSFDGLNGQILKTVYQSCLIDNKASVELCRQLQSDRSVTLRLTLTAFESDCSKSKLFFVVLSDITEFKNAQKAIIRSENKYKAVVENSLTGLFIEQDNSIIFANQRFAEILGFSMNQLIGKPMQVVLQSEKCDFDEEIEAVRKDGKLIWLKLKSQKIVYQGRPAALYSVIEISREKMMENRLLDLEQKFSDLSSTQKISEEKQRKKIALELHNGIGKSLTTTKSYLEELIRTHPPSSNLVEPLNKIAALLQSATDEARRLTVTLDPSFLEDFGLKATFIWHCQQYQAIYPSIKISINVRIDESCLAESIKTAAYMILQGVLNYIIEHYGTTQVKIHLFAIDGKLNLAIKDDGVSLSYNNDDVDRPHHLGLTQSSIKEITRNSGGKFAVGRNQQNLGNYFYFSWPTESSF